MNEIEKLYENCEIKKKKEYGCTDTWEICYHQKEYPNCKGCPFWELMGIKYPPFTAEKQLELIKWLAKNEILCRLESEYPYFERFEECIAYIINYLWQDLTEEEKEQIREILNG